MGQVPREAHAIQGLTNLDSVPLSVIVSKHFNERSFHQRKKWQTILVNNLPWQRIFKSLIWTVILLSIIVCFVHSSLYPKSRAFCCCWWKWENVGQRERVTSLPFWKSAVSSCADKTACVSTNPSLAPPQQRGTTVLTNTPLLWRHPQFGGTLLRNPLRDFRSTPGERDGRPSSPSPPGRHGAGSCGSVLAPCTEPTARRAHRAATPVALGDIGGWHRDILISQPRVSSPSLLLGARWRGIWFLF